MNLKQLFADEDAVSPVIGVILMVAITVILAAVIGTFVLGLGENVQDSAPQANFQFEYDGILDTDGDTMTITHTGGEDVAQGTITVLVDGDLAWDDGSVQSSTSSFDGATGWGSDPIDTGDSLELEHDGVTDYSGDSVRVVWTSPSGGTSNTIGQSTVPS